MTVTIMNFQAKDGLGESCTLPVKDADYLFVEVYGFGTDKVKLDKTTVFTALQMQRAMRDSKYNVTGNPELDERMAKIRRIVSSAKRRDAMMPMSDIDGGYHKWQSTKRFSFL